MKLLLLSNSTNPGENYLGYSKATLFEFLSGSHENIVFIPYAGVTIGWDDYADRVNQALQEVGLWVNAVHRHDDPVKVVEDSTSIVIGGGNSFQLLKTLYDRRLLELIREKVQQGTPYIGWSAGANMACPTLKTTNDMPIVEPSSFKALGLIGYQINPHYTEELLPNHGGESREMRISEYILANPDSRVIGLPEGVMLWVADDQVRLVGEKGCKTFRYGELSRWVFSDAELNEFLKGER